MREPIRISRGVRTKNVSEKINRQTDGFWEKPQLVWPSLKFDAGDRNWLPVIGQSGNGIPSISSLCLVGKPKVARVSKANPAARVRYGKAQVPVTAPTKKTGGNRQSRVTKKLLILVCHPCFVIGMYDRIISETDIWSPIIAGILLVNKINYIKWKIPEKADLFFYSKSIIYEDFCVYISAANCIHLLLVCDK